MPTDLETRLERAFASMPGPAAESRERALRGALDALGPPPVRSRRRRGLRMLVAAAAAAALITAGATLAATGSVTIPLVETATHARPPATTAAAPNPLPAGSAALVITVGDRMWSAGPHAVHPFARGLSTLAVSPGGLYDLEAAGHRLRAVAAGSGRVAFTHAVSGTVTGAAWSPLPIRIAFLVRTDGRDTLHDMWGTGSHDRHTAGVAAPVAPSWRWDSLAVAFVRADGRVGILRTTDGAVQTLPHECSITRARAIAFSPSQGLLAIAGERQLAVIDTTGSAPPRCLGYSPGAPRLAWVGGRRIAIGSGSSLQIVTVGWGGLQASATRLSGAIAALAASPHGHSLVVALEQPAGTTVIPVSADGVAGNPLFTLHGRHGSTLLQWR